MSATATSLLQSADAGGSPALQALLVPVGADWHLLDMRGVREVVIAPLVTELPTASSLVLGVFNLRGEIVPLFDTAALLGLGATRSSAFAAVVETPFGPAGLAATGVPEAVELGQSTGSTETRGTSASFTIGARVATLLDLAVLFAPTRAGA
jgi:purine-binding chemotaxis protein CheW